MPTPADIAQRTFDRLKKKGLFPGLREGAAPSLMGTKDKPLYSLYQSEDYHLRLYVEFTAQGPVYLFTTNFFDDHKHPPMVDPDDEMLDKDWAWLVHHYRLNTDMAYLADKLKEANLIGALPLARRLAEQKTREKEAWQARRDWEQAHQGTEREELAALLETTAARVRTQKGGLVVHEIRDLNDKQGFFTGCAVSISGYLGG